MADRQRRVRIARDTLHRLTDLAAMRALEYRGRANHFGASDDTVRAAQWALMASDAEAAVVEARAALGEEPRGPTFPEPPATA